MHISELQREAGVCSTQNGFREPTWIEGFKRTPSVGEKLALIHSEVSEALEAYRDDQAGVWIDPDTGKPEGVAIELADVVIRVAELCQLQRWDLEEAIEIKTKYNNTRNYRHGGKKI